MGPAHRAASEGGLELLAHVKARQSSVLGLWWRFTVWMHGHQTSSQVVVLLGAFLAFRIGTLVAKDLASPGLASLIEYAWLGICVYTWVGPGLFQRQLARELEQVRVRADY